ncbi:hypothetical protein OG814_33170 [Streptomyces zaomyceticus]|uniref:Uncharacterized protein n=1 Tax=Streptomyces zaomyceticus TaxID=68286 RepID=A0ABZ1LJ59_9ACTN
MMRLPFVSRRHMEAALTLAAAATQHLLDEEDKVLIAERTARASAEERIAKLVRGRADAAHVDSLEQRIQRLTRIVTQLRAGVVDDEQTAELRRQLGLAQSATRALAVRLDELTTANHSHDKEVRS